jgi:hypothetical protein
MSDREGLKAIASTVWAGVVGFLIVYGEFCLLQHIWPIDWKH